MTLIWSNLKTTCSGNVTQYLPSFDDVYHFYWVIFANLAIKLVVLLRSKPNPLAQRRTTRIDTPHPHKHFLQFNRQTEWERSCEGLLFMSRVGSLFFIEWFLRLHSMYSLFGSVLAPRTTFGGKILHFTALIAGKRDKLAARKRSNSDKNQQRTFCQHIPDIQRTALCVTSASSCENQAAQREWNRTHPTHASATLPLPS